MVLRNPSNKGVREYRPVMPDGSRVRTSKMQVQAAWPALVDEDTWQQVSDVLDARKKTRNFHQPGTGNSVRLYPFSGLIRCSGCGTTMIHRGPVYQCVQATRGGCHRSIRSNEISKLIEEAVLATFEQIALDPTRRSSRGDLTARVGLAATLDADRERLAQLDDDHYDGLIDKAMWVRQRTRIAERIERTRREYTATLPEHHVGPSIDVTTVATEWEGRTPMWQYQATSLILQAVLVHALPDGVNGATPARRRNESVEAFHVRRAAYRAEILAHRVEFIWRA